MAEKRPQRAQAEDQIAADLERWAGEGGAQVLPRALRYKSGELGDKERQILESLGAAVVSEWNKLPADVQRAIFQHAAANKTYDPARLRAQIARFLHNHKDDADTPRKTRGKI